MSFSLSIHPEAEADTEEIADYIAERSVDGMFRWLDALAEAMSQIRQTPLAFGVAPDDAEIQRGIRQKLFGTRHGLTYRIVYLIDGECVTILRVRGPGQQLLGRAEVPNG